VQSLWKDGLAAGPRGDHLEFADPLQRKRA
jgi:hypothetical protein